jgi:hypothetical protein
VFDGDGLHGGNLGRDRVCDHAEIARIAAGVPSR